MDAAFPGPSYHALLKLFLSALLFCNEVRDFPAIATKKATFSALVIALSGNRKARADRPKMEEGPWDSPALRGCPCLEARL